MVPATSVDIATLSLFQRFANLPQLKLRSLARLSSLRLQPSRLKAISCWSFTPARPAYPAASLRDFLSGALTRDGGERSGC